MQSLIGIPLCYVLLPLTKATFVSRYNNGYDEPTVAVTWFLRSDEQHSPTHPYPLTLTASIMLRHLPLITRHVEFTPLACTPLPSITACQEFTIAWEHSVSPPPVDCGSPPLLEALDASDDLMHSDNDNISGGALDEEDVDDEVKVILKPPGEPGHPKSSGYNLEQALSWLDAIYQQVNHVHREAHHRLETRKSFKDQKVKEIQAICDAAMNDHSIL
ncbi:hypothetical protein EDD18DRAFT_1363603 [Armillaria luteobubalina]|uniref:Uncharacterized protein n=1 Tax=Armillaria luteobubalina TaxID=153913 RepID=A0AA39U9D6_9AGAR|nr:hypothetical protein EDD18DRAFT_1363603 [Armillaria luteobubalina]